MTVGSLAMTKHLDVPYDDALARVKEALKAQGFGVLTEVDVQATLKEKLDADFRSYTIIGACNPRLAHCALQGDPEVGLLLPCNVIVYADDDGTTVSFFDPEVGMALAGAAALEPIAHEAKTLLRAALVAL